MKISYNWLKDYLPEEIVNSEMINDPYKLAGILTSVGLEVEEVYDFGETSGKLDSLLIGEVIGCEKHPNSDKLKIAVVNNGHGEMLQIVCGAPNVAVGQKVILAPMGATLYPIRGGSFKIKKSKIRGIESHGMLCAEDEIGIGENHEGIIVLPEDAKTGTSAGDFYKFYNDFIFEIGLTPNRMDAMSHLGVAKDVCAFMTHHYNMEAKPVSPFKNNFKADDDSYKIDVVVENTESCGRYSGVTISGITISHSPVWLQNKLKSIGIRPINNIVDITNFILHETGQPLHAFDADKIKCGKIIVKKLSPQTQFVTLDGKVRSLSDEDLMICNGNEEPMCFGGVFGGLESGVTENTANVFLESAWFNPASIRKTSLRHNLRTEAAIRFEKGVDISNAVNVLKRAALLIKEICGGTISSEIIDEYPIINTQKEVILKSDYLKKISGKNYQVSTVKNILTSLNFSVVNEEVDEITVAVPFSNPDITQPADIIEEIMRIDGLDNIEIPSSITISPAAETGTHESNLKERISGWLTGNGFSEIFTNSITNSKYFTGEVLKNTVKIINSLSEDLDVMRPSMMPTGLESIAYNLNRKISDLLFFEFGKTYCTNIPGKYQETDSLALFFTGRKREKSWQSTDEKVDIYFVKGVCANIFSLAGLKNYQLWPCKKDELDECITITVNENIVAEAGSISKAVKDKFSIKQPVFYLYINWQKLIALTPENNISFLEIPKFPQVERDLSIVVENKISYQSLENSINLLGLKKLIAMKLFDVFKNEKIGEGKKSLAINFTLADMDKTLTDDEIDGIMARIIHVLERDWNAEIRRNT